MMRKNFHDSNEKSLAEQFTYDPSRHCWSAVIKSITAITVFSMLLTVIETLIVYEIDKTSGGNSTLLFAAVFGIINSRILRKYVRVLSVEPIGSPRLACYLIIAFCTTLFIRLGIHIEHDARANIYHSKTLNEPTFNEEDYFYIDTPGIINYGENGRAIEYRYESSGKYSSNGRHIYTGYFVAPFRQAPSIFYVVKYELPYSSSYTSKGESEEKFKERFNDFITRIKPEINNHLFQRITHTSNEYLQAAIHNSLPLRDDYDENTKIKDLVLLTPMENDSMPIKYEELPVLAVFFIGYIIIISVILGFSKTEDCFSKSNAPEE